MIDIRLDVLPMYGGRNKGECVHCAGAGGGWECVIGIVDGGVYQPQGYP